MIYTKRQKSSNDTMEPNGSASPSSPRTPKLPRSEGPERIRPLPSPDFRIISKPAGSRTSFGCFSSGASKKVMPISFDTKRVGNNLVEVSVFTLGIRFILFVAFAYVLLNNILIYGFTGDWGDRYLIVTRLNNFALRSSEQLFEYYVIEIFFYGG